jgi:hypothetical protein
MQTVKWISLAVVYAAWLALLLWLVAGGPEERPR